MHGYARRTDPNHAEIRDGLRGCGYDVVDQSGIGNGIPDLAVVIRPGLSLHLEVKDRNSRKDKQELSKAEKEWFRYNAWNSRKVFNLEEALQAIQEFKAEIACWTTRI